MTATRNSNGKAYIRVTGIRSLLAAESFCDFSAWFQACHDPRSWKKVPSTFDFEAWRKEHDRNLLHARDYWEGHGYETTIEDQNDFRIVGESAILVGKPDLIARKGDEGIVIDMKTGKTKNADKVQVMLYMWAVNMVPRLKQDVKDYRGIVYYTGKRPPTKIAPHEINEDFDRSVVDLINRVSSDEPARKAPSVKECKYCNVSIADCPERVDEMDMATMTSAF